MGAGAATVIQPQSRAFAMMRHHAPPVPVYICSLTEKLLIIVCGIWRLWRTRLIDPRRWHPERLSVGDSESRKYVQTWKVKNMSMSQTLNKKDLTKSGKELFELAQVNSVLISVQK